MHLISNEHTKLISFEIFEKLVVMRNLYFKIHPPHPSALRTFLPVACAPDCSFWIVMQVVILDVFGCGVAALVQPYYSGVLKGSSSQEKGSSIIAFIKNLLRSNRKILNPFRNAWAIGALAGKFCLYLIRSFSFKEIEVVKPLDLRIL